MNYEGNPSEFTMLRDLIVEKCGIALSEEKSYLLESKLSKLFPESGVASFEELYTKIQRACNPEMLEDIIEALIINETFWFRDKTPWYIIEDLLVPDFIDKYKKGHADKLRIWSAACSYGQEPYSIAMCIDRYFKVRGILDIPIEKIEIAASDISKLALQKAELGEYDGISMSRGLEDQYRHLYFNKTGRDWKLCDEIRGRVSFRQINLMEKDFPFELYDIIFCRNVMIYFSEQSRKKVMEGMIKALKPGGVLFLGSSELYEDYGSSFFMEQHRNGIFYRKKE